MGWLGLLAVRLPAALSQRSLLSASALAAQGQRTKCQTEQRQRAWFWHGLRAVGNKKYFFVVRAVVQTLKIVDAVMR